MKYFSIVLLLLATIFTGCGDTDVDVKSSNVAVTTSDGTNYNFNGNIVIEWRSYGTTLDNDDELEVKDMKVEVDNIVYKTTWSWSKELEDLSSSDISNRETDVNFSFNIALPKSTSNRACTLTYTVSLDGDDTTRSIPCVAPAN